MTPSATPAPSAVHDFDFLVGTWTSRQRRLKKRLQGDDEWETFVGTTTVQRLPGGVANFDTLVAEAWRPGWVGMSFRVFNPVTNLWSIYWVTNEGGGIDATNGRLEPPVVGRFDGDEGIFEGDDQLDGRPIRVRFRWTRQGPSAAPGRSEAADAPPRGAASASELGGTDTARWEQAFSADAGRTWEVNWVMEFERVPTATPAPVEAAPRADVDCNLVDGNVVELRQYTLHPGQRDVLIDLFDREFVEAQEAAGIAVMGQFRDLEAPDRFVWLRGFADMQGRARALAAFYDGPVWQQHRDVANATMVDFDDVALLRPAWLGAGIAMRARKRAAGAVRMSLPGLVEASIFRLREAASPELLRFCRETMTPTLVRGGAEMLGWYVTEDAPNNFPRLPVRQGEHLLVGFAMFRTLAAFEAFVGSGLWALEVQPTLERWLGGATKNLRLIATARSAIHG